MEFGGGRFVAQGEHPRIALPPLRGMTPNSHQHFAAEENRRIRLPPLRSSAGGGPVTDIGPEAYIGGPFSPTHDRRREAMVLRANAEMHHHPPLGYPQQQHPQRRQAPADEDSFIGGAMLLFNQNGDA